MKTKLTISIDKELLDEFNKYCDSIGLNKSKYVSNLIKNNINKK
jgi:metal-responsive CopG/Arc/MetJ family transcriptional regulator